MLNKYWREYPLLLQLVLFTLMVFTVYSFMTYVFSSLVPLYNLVALTDVNSISKNSPRAVLDSLKLKQAVYSVSLFLIPPILFAYLTTPRPRQYLGFRAPGKPVQWLWVLLTMLGAVPVFIFIASLMHMINFGSKAAEMQKLNDTITEGMLQMHNLGDFVVVFFLLALLPAFGEEMVFRGIIMRFAAKRKTGFLPLGLGQNPIFSEFSDIPMSIKKMAYPIFLSGFMFAFMHSNVYGFVSIFLAGVLLATIYYLTGSIWCSILGHTLNNGLQIIIEYVFRDNATAKAVMDSNMLPWYIPTIGLVVFLLAFSQLWKNRTPLTYGWSEDFTPEEIINNTNEQ